MSMDSAQCPVCLSDRTIPIRDHLYSCRSCRIAFNSKFEPKLYDNDYFQNEYAKQYGKTYIDDFDSIYAISKSRVRKILGYLRIKKNSEDLSLIDIGSAAGFFLKCARDSGVGGVTGVELSEFASSYCLKEFRIPVIRLPFDDLAFQTTYDIITAWFFIEHCENPISAIRKIHAALNKGGVFAFSGPSIFGPLFAFHRDDWADTHPSDHRIDFSPGFVKSLLKKCGFTKTYVKVAGMHPERVLSPGSLLFRPFSLAYKLFSRATAFSDTIEVYAVK